MLKMLVDCLEQGQAAEPAEVVAECMMASNMILSYGGVTPATAFMGVNPRELEEFDGATQFGQVNSEYYLERSVRYRLIAKSCILKALVELRLTEANKTRPHQVDESTVVPGSAIEIYRARQCDEWWIRGTAKSRMTGVKLSCIQAVDHYTTSSNSERNIRSTSLT